VLLWLFVLWQKKYDRRAEWARAVQPLGYFIDKRGHDHRLPPFPGLCGAKGSGCHLRFAIAEKLYRRGPIGTSLGARDSGERGFRSGRLSGRSVTDPERACRRRHCLEYIHTSAEYLVHKLLLQSCCAHSCCRWCVYRRSERAHCPRPGTVQPRSCQLRLRMASVWTALALALVTF
jgi:hypothetical protein